MRGDYLTDHDKDVGNYDEDEEANRQFDEDGNEVELEPCCYCGRYGECPCDQH